MRRIALVSVMAMSLVGPVGHASGGGSLPAVTLGPRPGPAVLYEPLATTPILFNGGIWEAEPLMVSGAGAYLDGEYVYQDYVYDAYGANTTDATFTQPETTPNSSDTLFGGMTGDLVYPTNVARYGNDAADLLEFRARLTDDGIAYRITLTTMLEPDAAIVAIGRSYGATAAGDWGHGIGALGVPVDDVVVTWGTGATLGDDALPVTVDVARNQIEVRAPLPDADVVTHHIVVGVHAGEGRFAPVGQQPTATTPGGSYGASGVAPVFNVGFRFEVEGDEPMGSGTLAQPARGAELGPRGAGMGHWRDHGQATALAARDLGSFGVALDIGALADGETDTSAVPIAGYMNRLYVSHLSLGEGLRATRPMMLGPIQPYAVYVPKEREARAPLHLMLHSLSCSYNQYGVFTPNLLQELGEQRGAFVLMPGGRGPDGWWHDEAEVDVFEAWADLAARYDLDPDRVSVGGYSMGGYGTYRLASLYPDLFAKAFAIVGPADEDITGGPTGEGGVHNTMPIVENLHNVPLWMWNGAVDELVPVAGVLRFVDALDRAGLRYEFDLFAADHFLLSIADEWDRARDELLADVSVDRDPERIRYNVVPAMGSTALGLTYDHAYWLSDIELADGQATGRVAAWSMVGEYERGGYEITVEPGDGHPVPYVGRRSDWVAAGTMSEGNVLDLELRGIAGLTAWLERPGNVPDESLEVRIHADGPGVVTLAGSFGTVTVPYGAGETVAHPFA